MNFEKTHSLIQTLTMTVEVGWQVEGHEPVGNNDVEGLEVVAADVVSPLVQYLTRYKNMRLRVATLKRSMQIERSVAQQLGRRCMLDRKQKHYFGFLNMALKK
jgi:hypothetical protein